MKESASTAFCFHRRLQGYQKGLATWTRKVWLAPFLLGRVAASPVKVDGRVTREKEEEVMAQEIAFAAPRTEEMTRIVAAGGGAVVAGAVSGVAVKMAPQMGALEPIVKWGTLLGIPTIAAALALFTRGLLGDLFLGAACGGLGVAGYVGPEMLAPITGRKGGGGGGQQLSAEEKAALAAFVNKVKQLPPGPLNAPERAQAMAAVGAGYE